MVTKALIKKNGAILNYHSNRKPAFFATNCWHAKRLVICTFLFSISLFLSSLSLAQSDSYPNNYDALTLDQQTWLKRSCESTKVLGFSSYKSCVDRELLGIINGISQDISSLTHQQKVWLDRSCESTKVLGFSSYKSCVDRELIGIASIETKSDEVLSDDDTIDTKTLVQEQIDNLVNCPAGTIPSTQTGTCKLVEFENGSCEPGLEKAADNSCVLIEPKVAELSAGIEKNAEKQRVLKALGLYDGEVDGVFGAKSQAAENELIALKAVYKSLGLFSGEINSELNEVYVEVFNILQKTRIPQHVENRGFAREDFGIRVEALLVNQSNEVLSIARGYIQSVPSFDSLRDPRRLNKSTGAKKDNVTAIVVMVGIIVLFGMMILYAEVYSTSEAEETESSKTKNFKAGGSKNFEKQKPVDHDAEQDLGEHLLKLYAKLCKIDGVVDEVEIKAVKIIINSSTIKNAARIFKAAVNSSEKYEDIARIINRLINRDKTINSKETAKLLILAHLGKIIVADGKIDFKENQFFTQTARIFGFEQFVINDLLEELRSGVEAKKSKEYTNSNQKKPNVRSDLNIALEVLELNKNYTPDELKKARLKKVRELHPDVLRSQGLPEEIILERENLLKRVNAAYDLLKKQATTT